MLFVGEKVEEWTRVGFEEACGGEEVKRMALLAERTLVIIVW